MHRRLESGSLELFTHDWEALNARGNPQPVYDALRAHYQEPHRDYHTWEEHIVPGERDMEPLLSCFEVLDRAVFRMAWRGHDVIQKKGIKDHHNVAASVALIESLFQGARVKGQLVRRIGGLVFVTNHLVRPDNFWEKFILDNDLAVLGKSEDVFDRYDAGIEKEYDYVEPLVYATTRRSVMDKFRKRGDELYNLSDYQNRFGAQAIVNLDRLVGRLDERIAALTAV